jgi:hypothetical protein
MVMKVTFNPKIFHAFFKKSEPPDSVKQQKFTKIPTDDVVKKSFRKSPVPKNAKKRSK